MRTLITTQKSIGLIEGWTDYIVEIYDTVYSDKELYNSMKMSWRPGAKSWALQGSLKANKTETSDFLKQKLNRKFTNNEITVIET